MTYDSERASRAPPPSSPSSPRLSSTYLPAHTRGGSEWEAKTFVHLPARAHRILITSPVFLLLAMHQAKLSSRVTLVEQPHSEEAAGSQPHAACCVVGCNPWPPTPKISNSTHIYHVADGAAKRQPLQPARPTAHPLHRYPPASLGAELGTGSPEPIVGQLCVHPNARLAQRLHVGVARALLGPRRAEQHSPGRQGEAGGPRPCTLRQRHVDLVAQWQE
eukprot:scaffold22668_cov216-Isochrysis_galbana.AAC.3